MLVLRRAGSLLERQQMGCGLSSSGSDLPAAEAESGGVARDHLLSGNAGYCQEQEWIDLSTVKGYCRTVMCQEVRDELEANLTQPDCGTKDDQQDEQGEEEEEWQRILIAMCDGRLLPTPWLNKVVPSRTIYLYLFVLQVYCDFIDSFAS